MKYFNFLLFFSFVVIWGCADVQNKETTKPDLTKFVNPLIGTDAHGHTFPGASLPFGMVQLSPDTRLEGWDGCGGYHYSDSVVFGFSHTHLSGTGVPDYGDILLMPTVGEVKLNNGFTNPDDGYSSKFRHENEKAIAGFYATYLDDYGIAVELTTTKRVGFHKYIFPESKQANIIIDLEHRDKVVDSEIRIVDENEVEGYRRSTAWANDQIIYFVAQFSKSFRDYKISLDSIIVTESEVIGKNIQTALLFDTKKDEEILIKVGISAVSYEGARKNLEKEIPHWNFKQVKKEASDSME